MANTSFHPASLDRAREICETVAGTMRYLWSRWQERDEYENFNDYIDEIQAKLAEIAPEAEFKSLTAEPFVLTFTIDDTTYMLKQTAQASQLSFIVSCIQL